MSSENPFGEAATSGPVAATAEELARFAMNDLGNAYRLVRMVGGGVRDDGTVDHTNAELLYLRKRGWIAFTGKYWDLEGGEEAARRWAHKVAAGLGDQVGLMNDAVPIKERLKFAQGAGSSGSTSAMLAQAASYLAVDLKAFDREPLVLNVLNGTLKFGRGPGGPFVTLQARHNPADRITRLCDATYDPEAQRPQFDAHVAWCQPQVEMQRYLQRLFGYGTTGETEEQIFAILQGKGGDGKSTLVNAIRETLGSYAVTAGIETFLDAGVRRGAEASPDLARLAGDTRLICTAEPPRGSKLASGQIKAFTGGGMVTARELRQGIFEFEPIGKVILECNARPQINDTDDGIWRRLRIIMFEHQVKRENMDLKLPKKLREERNGILNWLVEGVLAWMKEGLVTPEPVLAALDDYRKGSNPFAEWFADRVVVDPTETTLASAFYADYKSWCDDNGHERPMTQTTFGKALGDLQIIRTKKDGSGKAMRRGARLRARDEALEDGSGPSGRSPAGPAPDVVADADWMEGD